MRTLVEDLRFALRILRANAGLTAIAVFALMIGIGANAAIFSVVNATLVRPLPYRDPQRLVFIQEKIAKFIDDYISVSAPDVLDFGSRNRTLEAVAGFQTLDMNLSGRGEPTLVKVDRVNANAFPLLDARPAIGRLFTKKEDEPGRLVAILSYGLWQRLFGGDNNAIGSTLMLDGKPYEVIGIMPKRFVFPPPGIADAEPGDLWIPMAFTPRELSAVADNFNISVIGRLKPGATVSRASEDINSIAHYLSEKYKYGEFGAKLEARAVSLPQLIAGKSRTLLYMLLGSVALVLLIACANVANLLLSRAAARKKEISIRAALGAGRARIVRQLLTESIVLALLGGAGGILLAWWTLSILVNSIPASIPRTNPIELDGTVLAFAAAVSLLTGIVFGIAPALSASRVSVTAGLNETGRGSTAGRQSNGLRRVLATAEMALALIVVAGAALLVKSFIAVRATDPGFRAERAMKMLVPLTETRYPTSAEVLAFDHELLGKICGLPGVTHCGAGSDLPLGGSDWNQVILPEGIAPSSQAKMPVASHTFVMGDYFQALGIALKQGRLLDAHDRAGAPYVIVINEKMARTFWPHQNAVGKRMKFGGMGPDTPWHEVVGVMSNAKLQSLDREPGPQFWETIDQARPRDVAGIGRYLNFVARTSGNPESLAARFQIAVHSIDKTLPVSALGTMEAEVARSTEPRRFNTYLMGLFAAIALLLAAIGIYGVIAYSVSMKTQEIGIRMALGAARPDVFRLVIREALIIACAGITVGLIGALALTRLISALLYDVKPWDPLTFAVVSVFLATVATAATCFPAFRATRVDPLVALRWE